MKRGFCRLKKKELSEEVKLEIIEEFERAFLPYFQDDRSRYNITWIEHSDKDRVELNFFNAKGWSENWKANLNVQQEP